MPTSSGVMIYSCWPLCRIRCCSRKSAALRENLDQIRPKAAERSASHLIQKLPCLLLVIEKHVVQRRRALKLHRKGISANHRLVHLHTLNLGHLAALVLSSSCNENLIMILGKRFKQLTSLLNLS
jgi:hypothetical protein